jgi:hypothetical protein
MAIPISMYDGIRLKITKQYGRDLPPGAPGHDMSITLGAGGP